MPPPAARASLVIAKHALKNTAIPLVTLWGLDVGVLFGGAVITESIFAWPGTGRLVIESVTRRVPHPIPWTLVRREDHPVSGIPR